ncbi:TonB-dependent receptor [Parabacteroides sp. PFB2-10]|uniref:TonB-dependent receptor n=1 Tax=Parabacteroides sp. PFB2-10 TaxID=1742405 RepID=UPI002476232C|nr:TonB-dependent receptor [Parabacteroides sp. PFB2-10]
MFAQSVSRTDFEGVVLDKNSREPIIGATVNLPQYGLWAVTNIDGEFIFKNVPEGETAIAFQYVGMVKLETRTTISKQTGNIPRFYMEEANFGIEEITVVAKSNKTGASTASTISRSAIDHLQATSLSDVLELLPGQLASNPSLTSASKPSLRQVQSDGLNSMGTSIVINGVPVSNNANLQVGNTATDGVLTTGYTSTAGSGTDMRRISADNIESVEVIRGIPSVEYGDLTSGVIIVNPKAGKSHYQARLKINPTLTQASVSKGFAVGKKDGSLSVDFDYAKSLADERRPYQGFQRVTANMLYSRTFLDNIRTTSGLRFYSDLDAQKLDPSDIKYQRKRSSENTGFNFNTNILWSLNQDFLKSVRFNVSADYAEQKGYTQEIKGNFGYMVTSAMLDGTVASNRSEQVVRADGQLVTNTDQPGREALTNILPYEFLTQMTTYGKPLNIFAKAVANMFTEFGGFDNRIVAGAEWRTDVNFGRGKVFDPLMPPTAGLRMRPYKDIPALNQLSVYVEDNVSKTIAGRDLKLQLGLRYDMIQPGRNDGGNVFSPRFNASYEIIPKTLTIRGGWGITAKAPPLVYLYPAPAYFDFINFNNIGAAGLADEQKLSIVTTKVFDTSNSSLKIAKNTKSEIGFEFEHGGMSFSVTVFLEKLKNGYSFSTDFSSYHLFELVKYRGTERPGTYPALTVDPAATKNMVMSYNTPMNNRVNQTKGLEFDFDFGRINAIRTSFVFNGAWMKSEMYSTTPSFFQKNPDADGNYKDIGVYGAGDGSSYERLSTNLRIIHNIPKISFVVSLSIQTIWSDKHTYLGLDNTTPIGYMSVQNGLKYIALNPGDVINPDIQKQILESRYITESYNPLWLFNLRLTKEIRNTLGFTFFLNNVFMNQPLEESKRNPGNYTLRNPKQFFGAEVWVKF